MDKQTKKALCGTTNTAVIMVRATAKNGSITIENSRYYSTELEEVFSAAELRLLASGEIVTKAGKGWEVKTDYASAAALFGRKLEG